MTKTTHIITVLLCAFGLTASAADPAFIVFYNSGKAVKTVNGKTFVLKKGDHLLPSDVISLPEKTRLALVCANFNVVQLKTKAKVKVSDLLKDCSVKSTSAPSAYFKYMWSQFSHSHKAPEKDPRKYMSNFGAASRGNVLATLVNVDTIYYYSGRLTIGWTPRSVMTVEVYDTNADKHVLLTTKPGISLKLDSVAHRIDKAGTYLWGFKDVKNPNLKSLVVLPKNEYQQLLKDILINVVETSPAETAYLSGYVLEEKRFLADAASYYQKAFKLAPDNQIYKEAYRRFNP